MPSATNTLAAITTPRLWMARVVRRRAVYLAPLLGLAAVLDIVGTFGVSWDDYAVLVALVVSAEVGRRAIDRARDPARQAMIFEAFFAVEIAIIVWATWWMSMTRWLGPTALMLELAFANMALPRRAAIRVSALAVVSYAGLVWAEALGWVRSNQSFGVASEAGNVQLAIVTSVASSVLLAFGAFVQREFAATLRVQEAASRQREQLELLGRVAASVAHDVNNVMTAVSLTSDALADAATEPGEIGTAAKDLRLAADRGHALMRQLLDYARSGQSTGGRTDATAVLERLRPMLERLAKGRGAVVVRADAPGAAVGLDATRLEQIVTNLVVNSLDASPNGARVEVELASWSAADGPGPARLSDGHAAMLTGGDVATFTRGVRLSVVDAGSGMPAEILDRVLEPFFTTKPEGRGTGLGLATVHTIVHGAGGALRLGTTPGVGTRVDVYLPESTA